MPLRRSIISQASIVRFLLFYQTPVVQVTPVTSPQFPLSLGRRHRGADMDFNAAKALV
jgi:hypothetical protein